MVSVPRRLQELLQALSRFLRSVCFARARPHPPRRQVLHHHRAPTTVEDLHPSLRTLWSAVIKSPKMSARSVALPVRLLQRAIVILVLKQISQFQSFGKWVLCCACPILLLLAALKVIHEKNWKRLGVLEHYHPPNFALNSSSHSGRSRNGSPRTSALSFLFGFSVSAGPRDESPRTASLMLSLLVDVGCSMGVTASCDEDVGEDELEELVDRPRTTNGT